MDYLVLVLILIVVSLGFWVFKLYRDKKEAELEAEVLAKEKDEYAEMGRGLAEYNQKLQEKKEQARAKIMKILKQKPKVSNRDVAKFLNISSASARRYFDELEAENKAKQMGKTGQSVFYKAV